MVKWLCLAIVFSSFGIYAQRDKKLLDIINQEIALIDKNNFRDDQLEYRYIELHSQKAKILRKSENARFLRESTSGKKIRNKKAYFQTSARVYQKTLRYALNSLKGKGRQHKFSQEIMYLIGHLDLIHNGGKLSKSFFNKILQGKKSKVYYQTAASLAELYYNDKSYQKAKELYSIAILNRGDKLLSKYLYLLAWCELKMEDRASATRHLEESITLSRRGYFDISNEAMATMAYFYFMNDQVDEAIAFLKRRSPNKADGFIKLADLAFDNGKLSSVPRLNNEIKRIARAQNNKEYYKKSLLIDLKFYRHSKQYNQHLSVTKVALGQLPTYKDEAFRNHVVDEVREFLTLIQLKQVYSGKEAVFKHMPQIKLNIQYYDILSKLDPENKFEYYFVEGELHFRIEDYNKAAQKYVEALTVLEKRKKKGEFYKKILDSLTAIYKRNEDPKVFAVIFPRFLKFYPKSDTTKKLLPIKFAQSMQMKKYNLAEVVVQKYAKSFPKEMKISQGMLAKLIDYYIANKKLGKLKAWSMKLDKGYLRFLASYRKKIHNTIATLELNNAVEIAKKDINLAENKYVMLTQNRFASPEIKGQALLALADIYVKKFKFIDASKWTEQSLKTLPNNEILKYTPQYYALAEQLALHQKFDKSLSLYKQVLNRYCQQDFEKKELYLENYLHYNILLERSKLKNLVRFVERCSGESQTDKWREKAVAHVFEYDLYKTYRSDLRAMARSLSFYRRMFKQVSKSYWETGEDNLLFAMKELASSLYFKQLSRREQQELTVINDIKKFRRDADIYMNRKFRKTGIVTEQKVNNDINLTLSELAKLDSRGQELIKIGHPEATVKITQLLSDIYTSASDKLSDYSFKGMPEAAIAAYSEQMKSMVQGLGDKAFDYLSASRKTIVNNDIFSQTALDRTPVMIKKEKDLNYRYPASIVTPLGGQR